MILPYLTLRQKEGTDQHSQMKVESCYLEGQISMIMVTDLIFLLLLLLEGKFLL